MSKPNALSIDSDRREESWATTEYLTIRLENQLFGIPVLQVQDVLGDQKVTPIPLAPPEVAGALNLRGRIVTAIDVRRSLGLKSLIASDKSAGKPTMSVVVEHHYELYSLIIDEVGDVMGFANDSYEKSPATLDPKWREISGGIYRLDRELMVVLDIAKLLNSFDSDGADI